jgi:hypothetical protein
MPVNGMAAPKRWQSTRSRLRKASWKSSFITPLEILENLVKFNRSKIANAALQVRKRKVELIKAEMKAPGRECAYVFDRQAGFSGKAPTLFRGLRREKVALTCSMANVRNRT